MSYNIDIELWEKTGDDDLSYFGDDRGRKSVKKGVAYISFLKNKTEPFRHLNFPDSKYLIRKKLFGRKIKYIINGVDLFPMSGFKISGNSLVQASVLPNYVKRDHLQRLELLHEDFQKKNNNAQTAMFVIGFGLITVVLFGFFVIWQSNVATAEATQSLASALGNVNTAAANSLPSSPT